MQTITAGLSDSSALAHILSQRLQDFLAPLLLRLDRALDRRLVKTFAALIEIFLQQRYRASGLLLSELGAFLCGPEHAPAGTKRLSNLLRSPRWSAELLSDFLWRAADARLRDLVCRNHEPLLLWDESVWEKPESIALEGLGSVRSSKAARLKRIRKGYYSPPPGPPVFVPGMNWLALLLMGRSGPPTLAAQRWWTTRGEHAQDKRALEEALLAQCAQCWGAAVLHVFDRGFAGAPWLAALAQAKARFVVRWQTKYHLQDLWGRERPAWQFARGKRTQDHRLIWDTRAQGYRRPYGIGPIQARSGWWSRAEARITSPGTC
jgi:hypothetical protein